MKKFLFAFGILSTAVLANPAPKQDSADNEGLIELLIVSKVTGTCGTIKQLVAFQDATKMPGGDEFIMRFINTEMARLGKELPEFLKECEAAVKIYSETMTALGHKD